jgi:hypothetical protein
MSDGEKRPFSLRGINKRIQNPKYSSKTYLVKQIQNDTIPSSTLASILYISYDTSYKVV